MGKAAKYLFVFTLIAIAITYGVYFYIVYNLSWKLSGFDIKNLESQFEKTEVEEGVEEESKGIADFKDRIFKKLVVKFKITNGSMFNLKMKNFKLKILDFNGIQVGSIETIRTIQVPAKSSNEVDVEVQDINTTAILSDAFSGKLKGYKYKVSGLLGGFLPFRYSDNII